MNDKPTGNIVLRAAQYVNIIERVENARDRLDYASETHEISRHGDLSIRETLASHAKFGGEILRCFGVITILTPSALKRKLLLGHIEGDYDVGVDRAKAIIANGGR